MAMLADLLKSVMSSRPESGHRPSYSQKDVRGAIPPMDNDEAKSKSVNPDILPMAQAINKDPKNIYSDKGDITGYDFGGKGGVGGGAGKGLDFIKGLLADIKENGPIPGLGNHNGHGTPGVLDKLLNDKTDSDPSNPFSNAIATSRANGDTGPGVLKQLLSGTIGGGVQPDTGTPSSNFLDNQSLAQNQKQANLAPSSDNVADQSSSAIPLPTPRPANAYAQPTALDPQSLEEIRQSLMTQAGQLDPNNPNGLSGRMNDPNSTADMGQQRNQAMGIEDSIRGFDGGPKPPNPLN